MFVSSGTTSIRTRYLFPKCGRQFREVQCIVDVHHGYSCVIFVRNTNVINSADIPEACSLCGVKQNACRACRSGIQRSREEMRKRYEEVLLPLQENVKNKVYGAITALDREEKEHGQHCVKVRIHLYL